MKRNIKDKDWEQLRINAHSLKPQADFMGLSALKKVLVEIEEAVKTNKLEKIDNLMDGAMDLSHHTTVSLNNILNDLI